jgi:hypothetical protein
VKEWKPTLGGIEIASALIAGVGVLAIADYVSFHLTYASINYLIVEMGMVGVATALVAYVHVHDRTRFGGVMLGLMMTAWAITAALLGPAMTPVLPLALLALLSSSAGIMRQLRAKALPSAH